MESNLPSFIVNGKCKKNKRTICNVGYACDACPYRKVRMRHKHEWEEKETQLKMKYIQCKTCKKISVPNKRPPIYIRRGKISYKTQGAFGSAKV